MTQTQLAEEMGVTSQTVTGWETGKSSPHFQVLLQLRDFFQIDLERLVYHDLQKEAASVGHSQSLVGDDMKVVELLKQLIGKIDILEERMNKIEKA